MKPGCAGRRGVVVAIVLLEVLGAITGAQADSAWYDVDAESLGRGGVWALSRLDRSPGAPMAAGAFLGFSAAEPFAGAGLAAGSVRLQAVFDTWAGAISLWQLQSPVHRETELRLAAQFRAAALCLGAGLQARAESFASYPTLWSTSVCLGAGAELGRGARATLAIEHLAARGAPPRLLVAAEAPLAAAVTAALQQEREPGLPARTLVGLSWRHDVLLFLVGHDLATQSSSAGVTLVWPHVHVAWAASSHAELGWSQTWTCELWR